MGVAAITDHSTRGAREFRAERSAKFGSFVSCSAAADVSFGHLAVSCMLAHPAIHTAAR